MSDNVEIRSRLNAPSVIVLGLIELMVIVGCVAGTPQPTPVPQPDADVQTAREAYLPAVEIVREQDPGAVLASGVGAWTPAINTANLQAGRTAWTFHFFLPESSQFAWVAVSRGGSARIVKIQAWETPPTLLSDQGWQVDSSQAIQHGLETCKATLAGNTDAQVEARLSLAASDRALVWAVSITSPSNPDAVCEVRIDATTGQVR